MEPRGPRNVSRENTTARPAFFEHAPPTYGSYVNRHEPKLDRWSKYDIGDVYERFMALGNSTTVPEDESDQPYLRHLKALSRNGWPNLLYLADFMESSTVPIKRKLLNENDRRERYSRTCVAILDHTPAGGLHVSHLDNLTNLAAALDTSQWKDEPGSQRLIISVDLSSEVIERLGTQYDIDPRFFRCHLNHYQWFHIRDPWYDAAPFKSQIPQLPFFYLKYPRLFYLRDKAASDQINAEVGNFNVLRSIQIDRTGSWTEPEQSSVGSLRTTMSFWQRPPQPGKGSVGVLLLDPDISSGVPIWGNFQNYYAPPGLHSQVLPMCPRPSSTLSAFIASAETMYADASGDVPSLSNLAAMHVRSIAAHWRFLMEYASNRLSIIEWVLQPPFPRKLGSLEDALQHLHPWRRVVPSYKALLERTISIIDHQRELESSSVSWKHLLIDFKELEGDRVALEARVDRITSAITAIIAIDENKKAANNATDVARITYLAFIFVPLSLLAGIFSMDTDFPSGGTTVYWVFAICAVPITTIPFFLAMHYDKISIWVGSFLKRSEIGVK